MTTTTASGDARGERIWAAAAAVVALLAVLASPTNALYVAVVLVALLPWVLEAVGRPLPLAWFAVLAVLPVLVAVALLGYGAVIFLLTLAATRIASRTDSRLAVATVTAIGIGTPFLALPRFGLDPGMVYFAVGNCFGILLGVLLRRTIRLTDDLRAADARLAEAAGRAERERIARDVHDLVAHSLTVVVLHVGGARRVLRTDPAAAEHALQEAEQVCRESLDGIRGVVGLLRGPEDSSALSLDLDELAATYRRAGVPVTLTVAGDPTALPLVDRVTLYRVLQEALANAGRHGGHGPVTAAVEIGGGAVTATVTNPLGPGRPTTERRAGGFGLVGLREQVAAQGGELTGGAGDGTWRVVCRLPVAAAAPASLPGIRP